MFCLLPTASEAMGRLGDQEAYIAYLPLAHVLELLAENVMLVLGIPIGYSTTNTLLDTSTMIARGSKVIIYSYIGYSTTNTQLDTSIMIARGSKVRIYSYIR